MSDDLFQDAAEPAPEPEPERVAADAASVKRRDVHGGQRVPDAAATDRPNVHLYEV